MDDTANAARRALLLAAVTTAAAVQATTQAEAQPPAAQPPPASTVLDVPTRSAAEATSIPSHVTHVRLFGYHAAGDGGGALYQRSDRVPDHALWFRSTDGAVWSWNDTRLDVRMAGARGDGRYDPGTCRILGGSDDTEAIQNAISAHCYFGLAEACYFPNRTFRITAPLHAHYGTASCQCRLIGFWNHRGNNPSEHYLEHPSGTTILCDFTEGMGISIAGSYGAHVKGLAIIGRNAAWIRASSLGYGEPQLDDTIAESWLDPALPPAAGQRYSPYCGITVDAFYEKGRPGYPAPNLPSYLKSRRIDRGSTHILIEECYIAGFAVAFADAPGGAPYSSDFIQMRRVVVERCQYGLSACQSQQRNLMRDSCFYSSCYCAETTSTHGNADGTLGISLNTSYAGVIHLFKLAASGGSKPWFNGMPVTFVGCYGESLWRIGDIAAETPVETSLVFDGCSFSFDSTRIPSRGVPATMLAGFKPGSPISITFRETRLYSYPSVFPVMFDSECVSADGLSMLSNNGIGITGDNYQGVGLRNRRYQRLASNVTADGLVLYDGASRTGRMRLKFNQYDVDARTPSRTTVRSMICGPTQRTDRSHTACAYVQRILGTRDADVEGTWLPGQTSRIDKRDLSSVRLDGKVLTFTLPPARRDETSLVYGGPLAGDVLLDQSTGSVLFVRSTQIGSGVVVAELQNNYYTLDNGRTFRHRVPIETAAGTLVVINARLYAPRATFRGRIEERSANLTGVTAPAADGPLGTLGLDVGDHLHVDRGDAAFERGETRIVSLAPDRIVVSGRARADDARRSFGVAVRPGTSA